MQIDVTKELYDTGSNIAGSLGCATLGFFVAGPPGVLLGSTVGSLITKIFQVMGCRFIEARDSKREKEKIAAVYAIALDKICQNLENHKPYDEKNDYFADFNGRPIAEELLEGILIGARNEHEEAKLPFLGNLYGNLPFQNDISRAKANYLIKLAQQLSYRQMCIINVVHNYHTRNLIKNKVSKFKSRITDNSNIVIKKKGFIPHGDAYWEAQELGHNGILDIRSNPENRLNSTTLDELGKLFFTLMELSSLPLSDVEKTEKDMKIF